MSTKKPQPIQKSSLLTHDNAQVYIYAEVDIDKLYQQIISKSKKVQKFLQQNSLQEDFLQKMRVYKHLVCDQFIKRICFDNQIQQFIYKKELNKELKNVKKNVFMALQEFLVARFQAFVEEEGLHKQYNQKVKEIELEFSRRIQELTKEYQ